MTYQLFQWLILLLNYHVHPGCFSKTNINQTAFGGKKIRSSHQREETAILCLFVWLPFCGFLVSGSSSRGWVLWWKTSADGDEIMGRLSGLVWLSFVKLSRPKITLHHQKWPWVWPKNRLDEHFWLVISEGKNRHRVKCKFTVRSHFIASQFMLKPDFDSGARKWTAFPQDLAFLQQVVSWNNFHLHPLPQ